MRIAVTADLHWGLSRRGDAATLALAERVRNLAPDVFVIAGDVGEGVEWSRCLGRFSDLRCPRVVLPGNHDLWVREPGRSSLDVYQRVLPQAAEEAGFHYLDRTPALFGRIAVAGGINWYDYSFADPALEREVPDVASMYRRKLFPTGRHNDGRFVHLGMSDEEFTGQLVERFASHLAGLPGEVEEVIAIHHHPPVRELFYPVALTTVDQRVWLAYSGNRRMQEAVLSDERITTVFCGHTHAALETMVAGRRCVNVGGDYDFKRLVVLDTETGELQASEFA